MQKKDNKEQAILKAAEKLFAEKGFKGATTTLIAAEAGVTHAMLHYYFRTKEHIFIKVFDSYMESIFRELKAMMIPDTYDIDLIRKVTELCFDFFNSHRGQMRLLLEIAEDRPDIMESYSSQFELYLSSSFSAHNDRIQKAVSCGAFKDITFKDLLMDIICVCSSSLFYEPVMNNITRMDKESEKDFLERRKKEAVEMIAGRLQPEPTVQNSNK